MTSVGLIDDSALAEMTREIVATFDTEVTWYQQFYDANSTPVSDLYGKKSWHDPVVLPARVTTEVQEFYNGSLVVQARFVRVTLPPYTGVRAGDVLLLKGQSFDRRNPIVSVAQVPSEDRSAFEFVTLGLGEGM